MTLFISKAIFHRSFVKKVEDISGQSFHKCMQCGTCSGCCPMTALTDYSTRKMVLMTHMGMKELVLKAKTPWICAACQSCGVRCPRGIDIPRVMEAIRQLVLRENVNYIEPGKVPETVVAEAPQIAMISCFRKHTS